ncbi:MAG TPA: response regulator, partial [Burkholderiales bacterium]|nr:response regulator [Burkholderiales bacterium]
NMLKVLGCEHDIVNNGEEALQAVERKRYDILLMDCQMPVMDGYAASRAIRERETATSATRRIPIVALTANALVGDKEQCLAAGMDDHLPKPYSREQLASVLMRWLPPELVEPPVRGGTKSVNESVPAAAALDQDALDNIRALDDDGTLLNQVIQVFLDDAPKQVRAIRRALAAGNAVELGNVAHAMKSACFNVGAQALGELCNRLEQHGKAADIGEAAKLVASIETVLQDVQPLLRAEIKRAA